jgi:hypothetical protein
VKIFWRWTLNCPPLCMTWSCNFAIPQVYYIAVKLWNFRVIHSDVINDIEKTHSRVQAAIPLKRAHVSKFKILKFDRKTHALSLANHAKLLIRARLPGWMICNYIERPECVYSFELISIVL